MYRTSMHFLYNVVQCTLKFVGVLGVDLVCWTFQRKKNLNWTELNTVSVREGEVWSTSHMSFFPLMLLYDIPGRLYIRVEDLPLTSKKSWLKCKPENDIGSHVQHSRKLLTEISLYTTHEREWYAQEKVFYIKNIEWLKYLRGSVNPN